MNLCGWCGKPTSGQDKTDSDGDTMHAKCRAAFRVYRVKELTIGRVRKEKQIVKDWWVSGPDTK